MQQDPFENFQPTKVEVDEAEDITTEEYTSVEANLREVSNYEEL
jgi:hypothetical protein